MLLPLLTISEARDTSLENKHTFTNMSAWDRAKIQGKVTDRVVGHVAIASDRVATVRSRS
jgi:hypothetical protein